MALFLVSHVAFRMTAAFGRHHSQFISESAASAFLFSDLIFMRTVGRTSGPVLLRPPELGELGPASCSAVQSEQGSHLPAFLEEISPSLV